LILQQNKYGCFGENAYYSILYNTFNWTFWAEIELLTQSFNFRYCTQYHCYCTETVTAGKTWKASQTVKGSVKRQYSWVRNPMLKFWNWAQSQLKMFIVLHRKPPHMHFHNFHSFFDDILHFEFLAYATSFTFLAKPFRKFPTKFLVGTIEGSFLANDTHLMNNFYGLRTYYNKSNIACKKQNFIYSYFVFIYPFKKFESQVYFP